MDIFIGVVKKMGTLGFIFFDLGIQYFDSLQRDFKIKAKPDHFTCMVDLLGRAGPKNLELAEFATRNLLDCDPSNATGYVQLANVYATMRKWD
ncbi:hypothetical protein L6452_03721 [Arctium lappa]|uniref:Uncharacterized protein n=1 Tax=Arctium lappa TaxID=4217 RepID=A0ACB9FN37_ARCLA|nr:hypothetical protein L6452_03721 [Arctium lappa]